MEKPLKSKEDEVLPSLDDDFGGGLDDSSNVTFGGCDGKSANKSNQGSSTASTGRGGIGGNQGRGNFCRGIRVGVDRAKSILKLLITLILILDFCNRILRIIMLGYH